MKIRLGEGSLVGLGVVLYLLLLICFAFYTDGTVDTGDSIYHYFFSKYAFLHPENFLNHWAKPLFVLLSASFAQFGFVGIKVFNAVVAAITVWFVYKVAKLLNFYKAWLAPVFLIFTPGYFTHILSGLTEPLFGMLLVCGLYLFFSRKYLFAAIVVSFLPFVRSEGLIIVGVFVVYFIFDKGYRFLPWLFVGHLFYSVVGAFYYHDVFWVFTKIPYSESSGKYGSGNWSHFLIQLNYILGVPLYVFLGFAFVLKTKLLFVKRFIAVVFDSSSSVIVYVLFFVFVLAHSLFWYFGIFESMGMKRVLIAVVPLGPLIVLDGLNRLTALFNKPIWQKSVFFLSVFTIVLFPFVPNPASINWKKDFTLSDDQLLIRDASMYIQANYFDKVFVYTAHPYYYLINDIDPFSADFIELKNLHKKQKPENYLIVWDSWFAPTENGITLNQLEADSALSIVKMFKSTTGNVVALFESKN
ncbi:MAG: hypothetical protein WBM13_13320 [Bacteroidia bacterium]